MTGKAVSATILVIDDEPPLLRLVARVLERQDFTVLTASDGDEAIDLFDKHIDSIDGVLLDIFIPPNGVAEVMDHMVSARGDLVVILSSGDDPEPAIAEKLKSQGGAFLRKPYLPKAMLKLLETQLDAKRQSRRERGHDESVPGREQEDV